MGYHSGGSLWLCGPAYVRCYVSVPIILRCMCRLSIIKQDSVPGGCQYSPTNWPAKNQQWHALRLWSGGWIKIKTHTSVLLRFPPIKRLVYKADETHTSCKLTLAGFLQSTRQPDSVNKNSGRERVLYCCQKGRQERSQLQGGAGAWVLEPDHVGPSLSSVRLSLGPLVTYGSQTAFFSRVQWRKWRGSRRWEAHGREGLRVIPTFKASVEKTGICQPFSRQHHGEGRMSGEDPVRIWPSPWRSCQTPKTDL